MKQHFCFPKADGKDQQAGPFSKLFDNELKVRFDVCRKGTVIEKRDLQDKCLDRFGVGIMAAGFKE